MWQSLITAETGVVARAVSKAGGLGFKGRRLGHIIINFVTVLEIFRHYYLVTQTRYFERPTTLAFYPPPFPKWGRNQNTNVDGIKRQGDGQYSKHEAILKYQFIQIHMAGIELTLTTAICFFSKRKQSLLAARRYKSWHSNYFCISLTQIT